MRHLTLALSILTLVTIHASQSEAANSAHSRDTSLARCTSLIFQSVEPEDVEGYIEACDEKATRLEITACKTGDAVCVRSVLGVDHE